MNSVYKKLALAAVVSAAVSSAAHADEFLVGAELPLTGTLARVGAGMQEGVMVAAEVFNRTNGKHKVKLITVDDESAPTTSRPHPTPPTN
jgi:branched-chain amino acid transport system substrate-binding protein